MVFASVLVPRGSKSDPLVTVGGNKEEVLEEVCDPGCTKTATAGRSNIRMYLSLGVLNPSQGGG